MKLKEFLEGFQKSSLREAEKHVSVNLIGLDSDYLSEIGLDSIERYLRNNRQLGYYTVINWERESQSNENLLIIHRLMMDGNYSDSIDWLDTTLSSINDATIRALLERYSKESLDSLSSGALRPTCEQSSKKCSQN